MPLRLVAPPRLRPTLWQYRALHSAQPHIRYGSTGHKEGAGPEEGALSGARPCAAHVPSPRQPPLHPSPRSPNIHPSTAAINGGKRGIEGRRRVGGGVEDLGDGVEFGEEELEQTLLRPLSEPLSHTHPPTPTARRAAGQHLSWRRPVRVLLAAYRSSVPGTA
eukprot:2003430-Rhodomonas_salina.1